MLSFHVSAGGRAQDAEGRQAERRRPSCHAGRSLDRSASSERNIVAVKVATAFALPSESDALDVFAYDGPFPAA